MTTRRIERILKSRPTLEGAGVHLKRAFGYSQVPMFDPFLMLDDFHSSNPDEYMAGFPWHPHRGIETITYVLQGLIEHGDSMGNKGAIGEGDVQWMTAGSGIIHQEMPKESPTGVMWGFQLWANLPARHKMMPPRYRDVKASQIPEVTLENGVRTRVVSGEAGGVVGPVGDIVIEPVFMDVTVPAGTSYSREIRTGDTAFAYVVEGEAYFDEGRDPFAREAVGSGWSDLSRPCACGPESVVLYGREGERITVNTSDKPVRFLFLSGRPINEPVAWYGPIVMNTQEELRVAFKEYRTGNFIKQRQ